MLNPGTMLGDRYEILEKIGAGGMADVYKALDHKLNRYDAVKVLKDEFASNKSFVSKFRAEAQALRQQMKSILPGSSFGKVQRGDSVNISLQGIKSKRIH